MLSFTQAPSYDAFSRDIPGSSPYELPMHSSRFERSLAPECADASAFVHSKYDMSHGLFFSVLFFLTTSLFLPDFDKRKELILTQCSNHVFQVVVSSLDFLFLRWSTGIG
jgi:hypothetical protein